MFHTQQPVGTEFKRRVASSRFEAMLCESRLWSMTYCTDLENVDTQPPVTDPQRSVRTGSQSAAATLLSTSPSCTPSTLQGSPEQNNGKGRSIFPRTSQNERPYRGSAQIQSQAFPYQALQHQRSKPGRQISPEMEIPGQAHSGGDMPFLVPSSCQSICQNYSDLHIGGDQVLPLSAHDGELLPCSENQAGGPFLQSCDVPPAAEGSPPVQASLDGPLCPLRGGSSRWRLGSGRDRSFLLQGREGPLSNSLLNRYLEHKLLDLYQQYMLESMARVGGGGSGSDPCSAYHLLGSEFILTSLDQITLQLSREGNLEAGRAKDMVLSCLLRVASGLQSGEISTPMLQISNEPSRDTPTDNEVQQPCPAALTSTDPPVKDTLGPSPGLLRHTDPLQNPPANELL